MPAWCPRSQSSLQKCAQSLSLQIRLEELHDVASDKVNRGINGRPNEVANGVVNNRCNASNKVASSNVFGGASDGLLEPGFQVLKPVNVRSNVRPNSLGDETHPGSNVISTEHHHQHSLRQPPPDECSDRGEGKDLHHDGPASRDNRAQESTSRFQDGHVCFHQLPISVGP